MTNAAAPVPSPAGAPLADRGVTPVPPLHTVGAMWTCPACQEWMRAAGVLPPTGDDYEATLPAGSFDAATGVER